MSDFTRKQVVRAPRATIYNWLGAFRAPLTPLAWGAIPVAEVLADIKSQRDAHAEAATRLVFASSPFAQLTEEQAGRIMPAFLNRTDNQEI
jgi:hypothetical protein